MQRELASLQARTPDAVSDVQEVLDGVLQLIEPLLSHHGARARLRSVQPHLITPVHPSVLRQVLIAAVGRLARYTSSGEIRISARLEDGDIRIAVTTPIPTEGRPLEGDLTRGIPLPDGASVRARLRGNRAFLWVVLPSLSKVTVLVVDDNQDMARLYRRFTDGTRFHVVHTADGQRLFEAIAANAPDVIVLDVMLPGVDGWELLMHLRQDPATRPIPVIVCTVVREEELALSLGAALYLAKPVRPRQFLRALDQGLARAPAGAPRARANSATAY
jgi:CheY-like chemotaxis protein